MLNVATKNLLAAIILFVVGGEAFQGKSLGRICHRRRLIASTHLSATFKEVRDDSDRKIDRKFVERNKSWIILVDDEEAIRQAVGDYLYDQGYQVSACSEADAVLEVCSQPPQPDMLPAVPDAIVSDIRMPGTDGIELLKMIRSDERLKRVPVILLTAKGMTSDRITGFKAGADAYLPKPFNPDELLSILDNVIMRRRQMQGENAGFVDLKQDMASIKLLMQQNTKDLVKETNVYLTPMEREVLELICMGYTNGEIAAERDVSVNITTRTVKRLYQITNSDTRTALVRWAFQTGYVSKRQ
jgi:DNA-binding response OmpR family regulator